MKSSSTGILTFPASSAHLHDFLDTASSVKVDSSLRHALRYGLDLNATEAVAYNELLCYMRGLHHTLVSEMSAKTWTLVGVSRLMRNFKRR